MIHRLSQHVRKSTLGLALGCAMTLPAVAGVLPSTAAASSVAPCPSPVTVGATVTVTCSYTGGLQTFTVPAGVSSVRFDVKGAQGGGETGVAGGNGGETTGTFPVSFGEVLSVLVGGGGGNPNGDGGAFGGYGGGGAGTGTNNGGGGGGGTFIFDGSDQLVLAAGGGGGSPDCGGSGDDAYGGGGGGGTSGQGGNDVNCTDSGGGGTQAAGGASFGGATPDSGPATLSGTDAVPGQGGAATAQGGGGGGGYYGGGGAASDGAGGGGSGYIGSAVQGGQMVTAENGVPSPSGPSAGTNGAVTITYSMLPPPTVLVVKPAGAASYGLGQVVDASFSCAEGAGGPGIGLCSGSVADGTRLDTATTGTHSFTVTATSKDGLTAKMTVTYTVAAPLLRVLSASALVRNNRVAVRLRCARAACSGTVKLQITKIVTAHHGKKVVRMHRTVVIGRARYTLAAGHTRTFSVKLNAAGRRHLAAVRNHGLRTTTVATVQHGVNAKRLGTIHVKRRKTHKQ